MNICFFVGNMGDCGGTEKMTQLLTDELSKYEGNKIFVLSKSNLKVKPGFTLDDKVIYSNLDNSRYIKIFSILKDIFLLRKFVRENKIDILINVDVSLGIFSLPLKILCPKLKQIFWEHFCVLYDIKNKRTAKIRKNALKYGDAYVVLTPQDKQQLEKIKTGRGGIINIPNICSFQHSHDDYDIHSKTILSVGNIIDVKGFDLALDAAVKVFKKHPDWSWKIYGSGSQEAELKQKVKELSLENNLKFMGRADDLTSAYKKTALFVLPSRSEGFGLVLIEAQAHNLPTVAFNVPYGPRNIVEHNINGYLIDPFDVDQMAEYICNLIENIELRKEFSANSAKNLYKYQANEVAQQWMTLFDKII